MLTFLEGARTCNHVDLLQAGHPATFSVSSHVGKRVPCDMSGSGVGFHITHTFCLT